MQFLRKSIVFIIICSYVCLIGCEPKKTDDIETPKTGENTTVNDKKDNDVKENKIDNTKQEGDSKVSFQTLAEGFNSGHNDKKDYTITSEDAWKSLWDTVNAIIEPKPELPKIDFTKEMVIAVFKGQQSGGGHSIKVEEIEGSNDAWTVKVKEVSPAPGGMMSMGFVQPYHIIKTIKTAKAVSFKQIK